MHLSGVGVRYGRAQPWVLRDVDLEVPAGTVVELTGANGAGKSSLLRVVAGVRAPSAGRVVGRPPVVGWVPERFPAEQPFTAGAYLARTARVRGLSASAASDAVERVGRQLRLAHLLGVALPALSKGSLQKVGLAQALLVRPGLLVLDEPWSGLDADARDAVPGLVADVVAGGGRVLVADHHGHVPALAPQLRWQVAEGAVLARPLDQPATRSVVVHLPEAEARRLAEELRGRGMQPDLR